MNRRKRRGDAHESSTTDPGGLTRRGFLRLSSLTTIAASSPEARDFWFEAAGATTRLAASAAPTASFTIVRRTDMIVMTVRVYNLQIARNPQRLALIDSAQPGFIVFELPPQHVLEAATPGASPAAIMETRLAGPSRLAFMLPQALGSIALRPEVLLDWEHNGLVPSVKDPATILPITAQQTLIEAPWGLAMTPSDIPHTWRASTTPVTRAGWTETWHARLAANVNGTVIEPPFATPLVRALETVGHVDPSADPVGAAPLTSAWRSAIRTQSSAAGAQNAIAVEYFALSALGATFTVQGAWPAPGTAVKLWRNQTAQGRDSFVRVVQGGFLMPWGFPVSLVTETERVFTIRAAGPVAYLYQKSYIVVRTANRNYPGPFASTANKVWALPFRSARINTLRSPLLTTPPSTPLAPGGTVNEAFWPTNASNGADVVWSITAYDHDGRPVTFTTPLAYVAEVNGAQKVAYNPTKTAALAGAYAHPSNTARRVVAFGGHRVALGPSATSNDTTFAIQSYAQGVAATTGLVQTYLNADEPAFVPVMDSADIELESIRAFSPTPVPATTVRYEQSNYSANGFPATAGTSGEVFLELANALPKPDIPLDRAGGLVAPVADVTGLSRRFGALSGPLTDMIGNSPTFKPDNWFGTATDLLPKLFGEIPINSLLAPSVPVVSGSTTAKLPKSTTRVDYPGSPPDRTKPPSGAVTTLQWSPTVRDSGDVLQFIGDPAKSFDLNAVISTPLADPAYPSSYDVRGEIRNFKLNLITGGSNRFLTLTFDRVRFAAHTGTKPTLVADLKKVEFAGALEFVNQLKDVLASAGKGPRVDVQPTGITVDYSVQLPNIGIGVFSLQNVALSTRLGLPFDGTPVFFEFAVSTADRPFLVTMGLFGGGGYFHLVITSQGVRSIAAEINIAAALELNLGVASGGVHISIGIGFKYIVSDPSVAGSTDVVDLYGIVRAGGALEVLGIITVSLEFVLDLHYLPLQQKAYGRAELTISIDILFFSTSVTLTCERYIGGGADPAFRDMVLSQGVWDTYCDAFA